MHEELILNETVSDTEIVKHRERYVKLLPIYGECIAKISAKQTVLTRAFQTQHSSSSKAFPKTPEAPPALNFHIPPIEIEHISGDYSK